MSAERGWNLVWRFFRSREQAPNLRRRPQRHHLIGGATGEEAPSYDAGIDRDVTERINDTPQSKHQGKGGLQRQGVQWTLELLGRKEPRVEPHLSRIEGQHD